MNPRKFKVILSIVCILAALGYLIYTGVDQSLVYFYTPSELKQNQQLAQTQNLRLGGMVRSLESDIPTRMHRFTISDGEYSINTEYQGVVPDLFGLDRGVIAEGQLKNNVFVATRLLVKHSEEYQPLGEGSDEVPHSFPMKDKS